jgi:hypothetical protein
MALEGCFLPSMEERTRLPLMNGIQFIPHLHFDQRGRLRQVSLDYTREQKVTPEQCLEVFKTAVDALTERYGPLTYLPSPRSNAREWIRVEATTAAGNRYTIGRRTTDGVYVTETMRSHRPSALPGNTRLASEHWDRRSHVRILSSFIRVNARPNCNVSVNYALGTEAARASSAQPASTMW